MKEKIAPSRLELLSAGMDRAWPHQNRQEKAKPLIAPPKQATNRRNTSRNFVQTFILSPGMERKMDQTSTASLNRLLQVAYGDTGQSRRVADFLLSWWNAATCGKWDPTDLWALDHEISEDILVLLRGIDASRSYPDTLGYQAQFDRLVRGWRPHLIKE